MERLPTRRGLISGAVGLTATAVAAGSASAATSPDAEAKALIDALRLERVGVIAYRQALSTSVLSPAVSAKLRLLLAQELQHVAKLERLLRELGSSVPQGPSGTAAAQALLAQHQVGLSLSQLPSQHACLRLLIDVESLIEGAYFRAIPQLGQPARIRVAMEMMGSDAQHWTVLSGIQHQGDVEQSVPYPFVQGSP
jgi:hypothetical protein